MAEGWRKDWLRDLYESYHQDVYRFARLSMGNHSDALDVVQEVFLRAYAAVDNYRHESSPKTWLLTIARNYVFDVFRRRKTERNYLRGQVGTTALTYRDPAESIDTLLTLERLVLELKPDYRQVFVLRHIEEFTVEETARVLGWTAEKVRTVDHRAIKRIRTLGDVKVKEVGLS